MPTRKTRGYGSVHKKGESGSKTVVNSSTKKPRTFKWGATTGAGSAVHTPIKQGKGSVASQRRKALGKKKK
jgi:hypothetical protein